MATAPNPTSRPFISHIRLRAVRSELIGRLTVTLDYLDRHGATVADSVTDIEALEAHARDCLAMAAAVRGMESGKVIPLHARSALMPEICVLPAETSQDDGPSALIAGDPFDAFVATYLVSRQLYRDWPKGAVEPGVSLSRVRDAYRAWSLSQGDPVPMKTQAIARRLENRGHYLSRRGKRFANGELAFPTLALSEAALIALTACPEASIAEREAR